MILDPTSSFENVPDYEAALDGKIGDLKIGVPVAYFMDNTDQPVALAFEEAIRVVANRGATAGRIAMPFIEAIHTYAGIVSGVEAASIHAEWMRTRPQDYAQHISSWFYAS